MNALRGLGLDTLLITRRNVLRIRHAPDLLTGFTIQPVMFVVLFVYVFGGAISTPGYDYVDYLMPGIMTQTIAFGGFLTAVGLNEDLSKGLIDRFRSLPMARPAVLAGRTLADMFMNTLAITLMTIVGVIIGFGFSTSVAEVALGVLLLLMFGFAFSWIFAIMGLGASSPESAGSVGFIFVFPLTFVSSAFVPVDTMPSWLQAFADINPFTVVVDAVRHLFIGTPAGNSVWGAFAWAIGLTVVFAPIAVRRYQRMVGK
jgi:ABC transporter DrrB family efflux protein